MKIYDENTIELPGEFMFQNSPADEKVGNLEQVFHFSICDNEENYVEVQYEINWAEGSPDENGRNFEKEMSAWRRKNILTFPELIRCYGDHILESLQEKFSLYNDKKVQFRNSEDLTFVQ